MDKVKLEIYHGGRLQLSPTMRYVGGSKHVYEDFDPDYITAPNIIADIKELGYYNYSNIWYKFENEDYAEISTFGNDKDVQRILNTLKKNDSKVIQLFVEHDVDEDPEIVVTSSLEPTLLTLTPPHSQIEEDTRDGESHRVEEEVPQLVDIEVEEADLLGCEFPDSDVEQPDLFFEVRDRRVERDEAIEQQDNEAAEQGGELSLVDIGPFNDTFGWDGEGHSEYNDSDELDSFDGSSDDETIRRSRVKSFNEATDFKRPINLEVGLKFADHKVYRRALKQYCIENGIVFKYQKNEKSRITVICTNKCGWRIHASETHDGEAFQVKTFYGKKHRCGWERDNRWVSSNWLAEKYIDHIRDQPDWNNIAFKNQVLRDHNLKVSRFQTYRAKRKAKKQVEGSHDQQFGKLRRYCEIIRETNSGSTMKLKIENSRFKRLYCCLDICKKGFLSACRPIICVDGCFLKGSFGGHLLSAVSKDGNENMYPIAYAVVESECKDSWQWFLDLLFADIGTPQEKGWVIMSDMQKGLHKVLESMGCDHRFCVRHLYANFKLKYKGKNLKDALWNASRATTVNEFKYHMSLLKNLDGHAYNWLNKYPTQVWSRHSFSPRTKCDILQNNIAETFNSFILDARDKPIITMLEIIRRLLMQRYVAKKEGMESYCGPICPRIQTKLERAKIESKNYICHATGDGRFEVDGPRERKVVDLNNRTCTCNSWDLTGIPCGHGVAAIYMMNWTPEDFVDPFYSTSTFIKAYSSTIGPVPDEDLWPPTNCNMILPPHYNTAPGRPKKARKRAADEPQNPYKNSRKGVTTRCGNCGALGHNHRTCKGPINSKRKIYKKKKKNSKDTGEKSTTLASENITNVSAN